MIHYIEDIMLTEYNMHRVVGIFHAWVRPTWTRGWEISPTKFQKTAILVKFLETQWAGVCCNISSKVEDKLLYLALPIKKKEKAYLVSLFLFQFKF